MTRRWVGVLLAGILAVLSAHAGAQDFFVRASRVAIVRDTPGTGGRELLRLERGDELNCVTPTQTDSFYNVFLSDGTQGWVSRYVVRLEGGATAAAPTAPIAPGVHEGMTVQDRERVAFHLDVGAPAGYTMLVREGYVAGYDPRLKVPVWVQYRLPEGRSADNTFPRTDDFQEDGDVPSHGRATDDDYEFSGYARGHMAPAEDMRWSMDAELTSNLFTNIAPQVGSSFNGSVWKTIENRVRVWAEDRDEVTVICGPVFEPVAAIDPVDDQPHTDRQVIYNVIGPNGVAVPTGFFKIIIDNTDPANPDVIAFLVRHMETVADSVHRDPAHWLASVDDIERATGLDFLTGFADSVQRELEREPASTMW